MNLINRLIAGFKGKKDFLEWKQQLIHSSFGHEEAVSEIIFFTKRDFEDMYIGTDGSKTYFREAVADYIIQHIFPVPQRFFSSRAQEIEKNEHHYVEVEE